MLRVAIIDVGTNSVLLLAADITIPGAVSILREEARITRLGEGMGRSRTINPAAIQRTIDTLVEYKELCGEYSVKTINVIGTEVFRHARNANDVIKRIKEDSDLDVEVLSGEEEAEYSFLSAIPDVSGNEEKFVVLDIGGGSTEIIAGNKKIRTFSESLKIGAVSLYERFIHHDPPNNSEIESARREVRNLLRDINRRDIFRANMTVVGIGGTVTTLAAVHLKLNKFDPEKIDGLELSKEDISNLFENLCRMSCDKRLELKGMEKGREDIIVTGTALLIEILEYFELELLRISTKGVRHGYFISKYQTARV